MNNVSATAADDVSAASHVFHRGANTRAVLERVVAGQSLAITVNGRAVATLEAIDRAQRWISREAFVDRILAHRADAGLRHERHQLAPVTTDDLGRA